MGVGTPGNIIEGVSRGVDLFDCVMPSRNARHGHLFTHAGIINLNNEKYKRDDTPIEPGCNCPTCRNHSKAYIRHLFKAGEMLAFRLAVTHNLYFYNKLMADIRLSLEMIHSPSLRSNMLIYLTQEYNSSYFISMLYLSII